MYSLLLELCDLWTAFQSLKKFCSSYISEATTDEAVDGVIMWKAQCTMSWVVQHEIWGSNKTGKTRRLTLIVSRFGVWARYQTKPLQTCRHTYGYENWMKEVNMQVSVIYSGNKHSYFVLYVIHTFNKTKKAFYWKLPNTTILNRNQLKLKYCFTPFSKLLVFL